MDKNTHTFYDVVVILSAKGDPVKGSGQAGLTQVTALVGDGLEAGEEKVADGEVGVWERAPGCGCL